MVQSRYLIIVLERHGGTVRRIGVIVSVVVVGPVGAVANRGGSYRVAIVHRWYGSIHD
jgi:hypothetical protein